jgi:hypothetical protein
MKNLLLPTLCAALAIAVATPAFAGKGDKKEEKKAERAAAQTLMSTYDKNGNGEIDGDEKEALRTALATDAAVKKLDTNADGKLDDAEIAAVKAPAKKEKKKNK